MTQLEELIAQTAKDIENAADELNDTMKTKAKLQYEWDLCFFYDRYGNPCNKSNDYKKEIKRLEAETVKKIKHIEKLRQTLADLQEADRLQSSDGEVWLPVNVDGNKYASRYEVSNKGNVRSYFNNKWGKRQAPKLLRPSNLDDFYRSVHLKDGQGEGRSYMVHVLVATAFIPNPNHYRCVNHLDCNKKNNRVENLEWCTHSMNTQHAIKHGLMKVRAIREIATGKVYQSILEASRATGCYPNRIYAHLEGSRMAKGEILYEYASRNQ